MGWLQFVIFRIGLNAPRRRRRDSKVANPHFMCAPRAVLSHQQKRLRAKCPCHSCPGIAVGYLRYGSARCQAGSSDFPKEPKKPARA